MVVERRRDRSLVADDVLVAERIEFIGGDAWYDPGGDNLENLGREAPRNPHFLDLFRVFNRNRHVFL